MDSDASIQKKLVQKLNKNNDDDEVDLLRFLHCLIIIGGCRDEKCYDKGKIITNSAPWK